ncbi:MAG: response regulator [Candidatus Omnitrophica bacterium]|nr:response regulator [Candidatus Omnitrophota bacterium]
MHKILIVDDNFENRMLLAEILREIAICDFAATGKEAIEAYNLSTQRQSAYNLILLDIELPEVNGLEILHRIRQSEKAAGVALGDGVPIIIVTAYEKRFVEAFNKGCDDYLLKPIDTDVLLNKIAVIFEKRDSD